MTELVARTVALPDGLPLDMIAIGGADGALLFAQEHLSIAARGSALRIPIPRGLEDPSATADALELLRSVKVEDDVRGRGSGPLAIGALPFDRRRPTELVVPAVLVGQDGSGGRWMTTVGAAGDEPRATIEALSSLPDFVAPDRFSLVSSRTHQDWCAVVERAIDTIRGTELEKVVLAREVVVDANRPFLPADILRRLHALYPSCAVFAVDGFVGASPELLVSRRGTQISSHPLAGTVARSGDATADERLVAAMWASPKERREHQLVVDAVAAALRPVCAKLDVPMQPSIMSLRNVSHLGTHVEGDLDPLDPPSALDLVARLHPTPAVAGTPRAVAVEFIDEHEGVDRGRYAGAVGWMSADGDGEWAVGIRSAEIRGRRARLYAGVGIVDGSDPAGELAETQLKLQALLAAVVRP